MGLIKIFKRVQLRTKLVNCSRLIRRRFLSIFEKYEVSENANKRFLNKKNRRRVLVVLSGVVIFLIIGNVVYLSRVSALDPSLLELIVSEMRAENLRRQKWNSAITFKQKMAGYASMASSALQPLIPVNRRYRFVYRLNYCTNILLNCYMLLLDFYRK
jgi:hypothetical protein